jgi:hypothetical protein
MIWTRRRAFSSVPDVSDLYRDGSLRDREDIAAKYSNSMTVSNPAEIQADFPHRRGASRTKDWTLKLACEDGVFHIVVNQSGTSDAPMWNN